MAHYSNEGLQLRLLTRSLDENLMEGESTACDNPSSDSRLPSAFSNQSSTIVHARSLQTDLAHRAVER
jgi:hypothetical protein